MCIYFQTPSLVRIKEAREIEIIILKQIEGIKKIIKLIKVNVILVTKNPAIQLIKR